MRKAKENLRKYGAVNPYDESIENLIDILKDMGMPMPNASKDEMINTFLDEMEAARRPRRQSTMPSLLNTPPKKRTTSRLSSLPKSSSARTPSGNNRLPKASSEKVGGGGGVGRGRTGGRVPRTSPFSFGEEREEREERRGGGGGKGGEEIVTSPQFKRVMGGDAGDFENEDDFVDLSPPSPPSSSSFSSSPPPSPLPTSPLQNFASPPSSPLPSPASPSHARREERKTQFTLPSFAEILLCILLLALQIYFIHSIFVVYSEDSVRYCDHFSSYTGPCIPCPRRNPGVRDCEGGELHCIRGFIRSAGKCIQDEHLVQQVEMMKEKIRDFVCERKATLHCFQNALISPFFLENFDQSYILETELKDMLKNSVYSQFDDVFAECSTLLSRNIIPGVASGGYTPNGDRIWACHDYTLPSSSFLSFSPLVCVAEEWMWEHLLFLFLVAVILVAFVILMKKKRLRSEDALFVQEFMAEVVEILQTQATQSDSSSQKWVPERVMRDEIFHRYPQNSRERNMRLWDQIIQTVETDSRIGKFPRMHQGEQCDTWQWTNL